MKRLIDISISSLLLVSLTPMFMVIAILIKLDCRGPVFFRQVRVGRYGRPFRIYKLRTMIINAERTGIYTTPNDDPRITRMGRVLRKYNIDELPQLINVLKGEMSIVGPRPEIPEYVEMFTKEEEAILTVRPGITDWATVWVRDKGALVAGNEDPERVYMEMIRPEKLRRQLEYVRNHSLWIDFRIMVKTLKVHLLDRLMNRSSAPPQSEGRDTRVS